MYLFLFAVVDQDLSDLQLKLKFLRKQMQQAGSNRTASTVPLVHMFLSDLSTFLDSKTNNTNMHYRTT